MQRDLAFATFSRSRSASNTCFQLTKVTTAEAQAKIRRP
jgi:hypothetical protein